MIDLGNVAERTRAIDAINEAKADEEAAERLAVWDKAMQRAFKGIVPRPERIKALKRAAARQ